MKYYFQNQPVGEKGTVWTINSNDLTRNFNPPYDDGRGNKYYYGGYTASMIGLPEWGIEHILNPGYDSASWFIQYRDCCTAAGWYGELLTVKLMGLEDALNHPSLFGYQERYEKEMRKTYSPPDSRLAKDHWQLEMWDAYYTNTPSCTSNDPPRTCSTGQPGVCSTGKQTCTNNQWGTCVQDNQPSTEICTDAKDNDCDGKIDLLDEDCFKSCSEQSGFSCLSMQTCPGTQLTHTGTGICCNVACESPKTCEQLGGTTCQQNQECFGGIIKTASDTALCCVGGTCKVSEPLVAKYSFENNFNDDSGKANNGVNKNNVKFGAGKVGSFAATFDGTNYVEVPISSSLKPSSEITIATWVNVPSSFTGFEQILTNPVSKTQDIPPNFYGYSIYFRQPDSTGRHPYLWLVLNGNPVELKSTANVLSDSWHHIAGTYDGTNMKFYVDGVQTNSQPASGSITTYDTVLRIGTDGGIYDRFQGSLDDLRIYNKALTASEVATLAGNSNPTNNPPVLNSIGDKTINEGQTLSFTISATDDDNDPLTFSAENLPNGATFSTVDKQFIWKPSFLDSNVYTGIKFKVSDGKGGEDFETIQITVKDVPDQDSDGSPDSLDCNVKEPSIKQCGGCASRSPNEGNRECDISPPKPIVCPSSTRCGEFGCETTEIKTFTST